MKPMNVMKPMIIPKLKTPICKNARRQPVAARTAAFVAAGWPLPPCRDRFHHRSRVNTSTNASNFAPDLLQIVR